MEQLNLMKYLIIFLHKDFYNIENIMNDSLAIMATLTSVISFEYTNLCLY